MSQHLLCPVSRFIQATKPHGLEGLLTQCRVEYKQEILEIQANPVIGETLWMQHLLVGYCASHHFPDESWVEISSNANLRYRFPTNLLTRLGKDSHQDHEIVLRAIASQKPFMVVANHDNRVLYASYSMAHCTGVEAKHWLHCDMTPFWRLPGECLDEMPSQLAALYRYRKRGDRQVYDFEATIKQGRYLPPDRYPVCCGSIKIIADVFFLESFFEFPCRLTIIKDHA